MTGSRNQFGRINETRESRIEWLEARVSALTSRYTEIMSAAWSLKRRFDAEGDADASRIAGEWHDAALAMTRRAMKVGLKAEKHATRKRIERMQAAREDAWHKRMGWVK